MAKLAEKDWGFTEIRRKFEPDSSPARRQAPRVRHLQVPSSGAAHVGLWLTAVAICLLGLVSIRVGLLTKNLEFNNLITDKTELSAETVRLSSEVAALRSPERVEQIATGSLGMVPAGKVQYVYISPAGTRQSYADLDLLGAGVAGRAAP
ncbi:MAG: cell division protein FtsL [Thermoleophilia bacterium]